MSDQEQLPESACKRRKSSEEKTEDHCDAAAPMIDKECSESNSGSLTYSNSKGNIDSGMSTDTDQVRLEDKSPVENCIQNDISSTPDVSETEVAMNVDSGLEVACNVTVERNADEPSSTTGRRSARNYRRAAMDDAPSSPLPTNDTDAVGEANSPRNALTSSPYPDNETASASDMHSDGEDSMMSRLQNPASYTSSDSHVFPDDEEDDNDDGDDDDDYDDINAASDIECQNNEGDDADTVKELLNKQKPTYTWNSTYELMRREHGITGDGRCSLRNGMNDFNRRFYASRHVVERMQLSHCLRKHKGCVNCLNFNGEGDLLCTGSDDKRIIVWDWAMGKSKAIIKSGHTENIFQTKFIHSAGCLDIVSASRDGQVRRAIIPPSGGKGATSCLYKHNGSVHKLVVCPQSPFEIISAGEDGNIRHKDLRSAACASDLLKVVAKHRKVRLFSISHHPFAPEICVCGCDNFVRVYDKRNVSKTVHEMCPESLIEMPKYQVTCCVYNSQGTEILASYSDDDIYLFNNKTYKTGDFLHRYRGHYNHKTIKGVNFFGPNSEYVISGSDCGNIFFWDKNTEAILNFMSGDKNGVVNCLEPHPSIPVLATSGLDDNIKIWMPNSAQYPPDLSKLEARIKRNLRRSVVEEGYDFSDRQFRYFIRQFLRHPRGNRTGLVRDAINIDSDDDSNMSDPQLWTSTSSSSDSSNDFDEGDADRHVESIHCHTQ